MGMKTAISVPDEVFEKGEATAKRLKISRSELYSRALQAFLDSHSPDRVTSGWDAVIKEIGQPDTSVSEHASRSVFETTEW
jgi:metal-responsive CopG/Arc/MetJ family transcriptional regulator